MLSPDVLPDDSAPVSERRLVANRANAQLSTGPRTPEGKAVSSLNAVKTGLCGRAVLLADEEEAGAYREHVERVFEWWSPDGLEEYALVQSLADTQWRLESIPGLESALYAQARRRGTPLPEHPDSTVQRLLLDAQTEVAEAKALKNLRLHERRLRRQFEKDRAELNELRRERFAHEEQEAEEEEQCREEQAQKRDARRQARGKEAQGADGFEFATVPKPGKATGTRRHQNE